MIFDEVLQTPNITSATSKPCDVLFLNFIEFQFLHLISEDEYGEGCIMTFRGSRHFCLNGPLTL